jgi:hypothetical protein
MKAVPGRCRLCTTFATSFDGESWQVLNIGVRLGMRRIYALMFILVFARSGRATTPCERGVDLLPPVLAPADGATSVPLNVKPVISRSTSDAPARLLVDGIGVPHSVEWFDVVDGFGPAEMTRLVPIEALRAGVTVTIELDDGTTSIFTTGDAPDDVAPNAPTLGAARDYSGGACTPFVEIPVSGDGEPAVYIARLDWDAPLELRNNVNLNGLGVDDAIVVGADTSGEWGVAVAAVDLAGNVSETSMTTAEFPEEFRGACGCSHLDGSTVGLGTQIMAMLLLFSLAIPRRGRCEAVRTNDCAAGGEQCTAASPAAGASQMIA